MALILLSNIYSCFHYILLEKTYQTSEVQNFLKEYVYVLATVDAISKPKPNVAKDGCWQFDFFYDNVVYGFHSLDVFEFLPMISHS